MAQEECYKSRTDGITSEWNNWDVLSQMLKMQNDSEESGSLERETAYTVLLRSVRGRCPKNVPNHIKLGEVNFNAL